jgi:hypothetical protein
LTSQSQTIRKCEGHATRRDMRLWIYTGNEHNNFYDTHERGHGGRQASMSTNVYIAILYSSIGILSSCFCTMTWKRYSLWRSTKMYICCFCLSKRTKIPIFWQIFDWFQFQNGKKWPVNIVYTYLNIDKSRNIIDLVQLLAVEFNKDLYWLLLNK